MVPTQLEWSSHPHKPPSPFTAFHTYVNHHQKCYTDNRLTWFLGPVADCSSQRCALWPSLTSFALREYYWAPAAGVAPSWAGTQAWGNSLSWVLGNTKAKGCGALLLLCQTPALACNSYASLSADTESLAFANPASAQAQGETHKICRAGDFDLVFS